MQIGETEVLLTVAVLSCPAKNRSMNLLCALDIDISWPMDGQEESDWHVFILIMWESEARRRTLDASTWKCREAFIS